MIRVMDIFKNSLKTEPESNHNVVIVIPVYRSMTVLERVSMMQCLCVMGKYPIVLIAGRSFKADDFLNIRQFRIEYFDDIYFKSNQSYSRLMLLPEFYKRFVDYDYMLIYQLDAFVFSDRLIEFCDMEYDYIGAPMPSWGKNWKEIGCNIGNGGFSLRKIKSFIKVLNQMEYILDRRPKDWTREHFLPMEDVFLHSVQHFLS